MPRAEKGSAKAIANKVKSKGLQKLKWFCQMCNKQCRDQNGFKCHLTSESHQRQLLLFAENEKSYLREFSREFESNFMRILRHQFGTKRIRANEVYQEIIKDKGHIHMNSTVWHTLTGFVLYLGSSGKCKIDEGEKGWYIQYIDQEEEIRRGKILDRAKKEKDEEERNAELLERQIARAREKEMESGEPVEEEKKELVREDPDEKITISITPAKLLDKKDENTTLAPSSAFDSLKSSSSSRKEKERDRDRDHGRERDRDDRRRHYSYDRDRERDDRKRPSSSKPEASKSKRSTLEQMKQEEERFKERKNRKDFWLHEGIIVKVVTKKLGAQYYKAKGEIVELVDKYTAKVDVDGDILKLDQNFLETVIPAIGRDMLVVNGAYRGSKCTLLEIKEDDFSVVLKIKEGLRHGREVTVKYEDASKLA